MISFESHGSFIPARTRSHMLAPRDANGLRFPEVPGRARGRGEQVTVPPRPGDTNPLAHQLARLLQASQGSRAVGAPRVEATPP